MNEEMKQEKTAETYQGFTVKLALVDMLPVLIFAIMSGRIALFLQDILFTIGVILMVLGGLCKVLWKLLLACLKRDIHWLNRPLFIVFMPLGGITLLLAVIREAVLGQLQISSILHAVMGFPSVIFFVLGTLGIIAMTIFFKVHDKTDPRNNWIEQFTNTFAQFMFLLGVLFI